MGSSLCFVLCMGFVRSSSFSWDIVSRIAGICCKCSLGLGLGRGDFLDFLSPARWDRVFQVWLGDVWRG